MIDRIVSRLSRPIPGDLAAQYAEMHAKALFPGDSWKVHYRTLCETIPNLDSLRIVDFGCGPSGGLAQALPSQVISYDPYVEQYSTPPWDKPFDVVFSSDVFEHIPRSQVASVLETIGRCRPTFIFLNISTRLAHKRLPDGRNAHLTVKSASWWLSTVRSQLGNSYGPRLAREDLLRAEVSLCFQHQ
jgi:hypothetical protein